MENIQENTLNNNNELSDEKINEIRKMLTCNDNSILERIYKASGINHNTLAEQLEKSKSNLSNMMKRIEKAQIPLISIKKEGREKHYSLTPLAQQYVEQEILPDSQPATNTPQAAKDIVQMALDALELLKKEAQESGNDWKEALHDLILEQPKVISDDLQSAYTKFIELLYHCKKENIDALSQIFESLEEGSEDSLLVQLLKKHLAEKFYYYDRIKFLQELNYTNKRKVVNGIFSVLYPFAFPPNSSSEQKSNELVPLEEYDKILVCIAKLSTEFHNQQYDDENAAKQWNTSYFLDEFLASHIAEKCLELKRALSLLSKRNNNQ